MVEYTNNDILAERLSQDSEISSTSPESSDAHHFSEAIITSAKYNVTGYSISDKFVNISTDTITNGDDSTAQAENVKKMPHQVMGVYHEELESLAAEGPSSGTYTDQSEYIESGFTTAQEQATEEEELLQTQDEQKQDKEGELESIEPFSSIEIDSTLTEPNYQKEFNQLEQPIADEHEEHYSPDIVNIDNFTMVNHDYKTEPIAEDMEEELEVEEEKEEPEILQEVEKENVNDAPVIINGQEFSITEAAANGMVVANVRAYDADIPYGDKLTYSITGGNDGAFTIDPDSGQITVADSTKLVHETNNLYSLEITVTDQSGAKDVESISINVTDFFAEFTGSESNDRMYGTSANERFMLGGNSTGYDLVYAGGGDDTAYGQDGTDLLGGDTTSAITTTNLAGDDFLSGGAGNDYVIGEGIYYVTGAGAVGGNDTLYGDEGNDLMFGDSYLGVSSGGEGGDDLIYGGEGNDTIYGEGFYIAGSSSKGGDDVIYGGAGNDTIYGDARVNQGQGGDDTIDGGSGSDSIYAGSGDDNIMFDQYDTIISGGAGTDTLTLQDDSIDLTQFSTITGIDKLNWSDVVENGSVSLDYHTVVQISDSKTLTIDGEAGDTINLTGGNWSLGGIENGYQVYDNNDVKVLVDSDIFNSSGVNIS